MSHFDRLFEQLYPEGKAPAEEAAPEQAALPTAGKSRKRKVEEAPPPPPLPPPPVPDPSQPLDASHFLPIEHSDFRQQARKLRRSWEWFGQRDRIPPAADPRTSLVDRALVTNGLLTPEQLAAIHHVGDEMERFRPLLEGIEQKAKAAGEAVVRAERERKAKLKKQKKAEAEKRRQKRAADIQKWRETHIDFLGRGVSGRLYDYTTDKTKLRKAGLPVLTTSADVAKALNLSIPKLRWLAFHTPVAQRVHYVYFTVPKKSGGTRTLCAPHRTLAAAQRWILENILAKLEVEEPAHGFVPGRSVVSNAQPHAGQDVVLNMDLEGFFPNITFPRVASVFRRLGYSPAVATILALLCTECPRKKVRYAGEEYHVATGPRGLPQGACTSPALSNQVARRIDKRFAGLAEKLGLVYTRYADDLTFSGGEELAGKVGYVMARVRHIAQEEGFAVNEKKTRVLRRSTAQVVTGLVVNDRPGVKREDVRRLRAILHHARGEGLDAQNREGRPNFRAWLRGKIAYVNMVRPEVGKKMLAELDALEASEGRG
jgi:RNA-directed DNA polymerase